MGQTHTHLSGVTKTPVAGHCALCLVFAVRGGGQDSSEVGRNEYKGKQVWVVNSASEFGTKYNMTVAHESLEYFVQVQV